MVKRLMIEKADRLYHLPPTLEEFLPRWDRQGRLLKREVIDLARLNWPTEDNPSDQTGDLQDPEKMLETLREKIAEWYQKRFSTRIKSDKEIFIGSRLREILNLTALAFFNPGDILLIPDPGIWHYRTAAVLASAETVRYNLTERHGFQPLPETISENLSRLARGIFINNPHNPTGATVDSDSLGVLLKLAGRENLLIILDQAFDGLTGENEPASLFSLPGGRKVALELYSLAYNCAAPGPALGFAIGQTSLIRGLNRVASLFGMHPTALDMAYALQALANADENRKTLRRKIIANRALMDRLCSRVRLLPASQTAGPFYWAKLPGRLQSRRYCRQLYMRCGILSVPGTAFGENGEGFVRFSLLQSEDKYLRALEAANRFTSLSGRKERQNG